MIIARRPKGPAVIITDCSWKLSDRWLDRVLCRLGVSAVDSPRVTYCVRSTEELRLLPSAWRIDPSRVVFTPYGHTLSAEELALSEPDRSGVFAGGNALRDYATLVDAVRGLPTDVTIATSLPISVDEEPNIRVVPVTPHDRFIDLLRRAHVVAVPFQTGIRRASGLDTYLAAMALGQIVIVSRCPGTSDYIEDGRTGIVVPPGDVAALRRALEWCSTRRQRRRGSDQRPRTTGRSRTIQLRAPRRDPARRRRRGHRCQRWSDHPGWIASVSAEKTRADALRVCMAIQSFRPTVGGGELQLERLLPHLVRRGARRDGSDARLPGQPRREVSGGAIVHRSALSGRSAASSIAFVGEGLTRLVPLAVRRHRFFTRTERCRKERSRLPLPRWWFRRGHCFGTVGWRLRAACLQTRWTAQTSVAAAAGMVHRVERREQERTGSCSWRSPFRTHLRDTERRRLRLIDPPCPKSERACVRSSDGHPGPPPSTSGGSSTSREPTP